MSITHLTADNIGNIDTDELTSVSLEQSDWYAIYKSMRLDGSWGETICGPFRTMEDAERLRGEINDITGYDKQNPSGVFLRAQQGTK
jgi:hypothetical protein